MVEWDEPGNPQNVVQRKNITALDKGDPLNVAVGDMCDVKVQEGRRVAHYRANVFSACLQ